MTTINYADYEASLKEVSVDTAKDTVYMCDSNKKVVNFDSFLQDYFKLFDKGNKPPESVDAYCLVEKRRCLIEFKNGRISSEQRRNIVGKIGHSVLTVLSKDQLSLVEFKKNSIFILVYNKDEAFKKAPRDITKLYPDEIQLSSSKLQISDRLASKASMNKVTSFGMSTFKDIYFDDVITIDKDDFNRFIKKVNVEIPLEQIDSLN